MDILESKHPVVCITKVIFVDLFQKKEIQINTK